MAEHFGKAAERGVPSLVWRAGQNRRLKMIEAAAGNRLQPGRRVLVDGCGLGMYNRALGDYTPHVHGLDIEAERIQAGAQHSPNLLVAQGEYLPYEDCAFDLVLSHEVMEHVIDDARYAAELVRVLKPGGRGVIFCPNRLYPFEVHGHYWRGTYYFGNTPLINYLPDMWRNRLAPHVRVYTQSGLRRLFEGLTVQIVTHTRIYPGYDNIVNRLPTLGRWLRRVTYMLEKTPMRAFGISHLMVVEKRAGLGGKSL